MSDPNSPALSPFTADPHAAIAPSAFRELPSGAVMPGGRWKGSLESIAEGWLRRIVEARDPRYYSAFWERNTFGPLPGDVHAEWAGYTADALVRLAHLLPDSWIVREKEVWLERVLASQDGDGYLGAYRPEHRWRHGFEIWSQDRLLQALLCEYEHSGDSRILDSCVRATRRLVAQFETPEWRHLYARPRGEAAPHQAGHSLNIIHPLVRLSELTGDPAFRDLALSIYADYDGASGEYSAARFLSAEKILAHIVTVCEHLSIPAAAHAAGGPHRWLEGSLHALDLLCAQSLQVTGILSGNEATYGSGPRKYTEHCGVIEWMISCSRLLELTGEVRFADLAERAMVNAYFASRAPDGGTVAYNHAPNQLVATNWTAPYEDNWDRAQFRAHYSAHHEPCCCNANTSRGFPNYVQRAAMLTPEGGLALVYYGPCRVAARLPGRGEGDGGAAQGEEVRLALDTDYPYEDEVRIEIEAAPAEAFPLLLRIPGWCRAAEVKVNGRALEEAPQPGTFYRLVRNWRPGDRIELSLDVPVTLHTYTASWHSVPGVAVTRGPLTFALPLDEQWVSAGDAAPDGQHQEWNVLPHTGALWNVALDLDLKYPERSLRLVKCGMRNAECRMTNSPIPHSAFRIPHWEAPPIGLVCPARVLPHWLADTINGRLQTPGLPPPPLRPGGEPIEVTLVPFAFTHIRMTYLPVLGFEEPRRVLYDQGKAAGG